jgi:hypothetical protein
MSYLDDPVERSRRAAIAANVRWAKCEDRAAATAPAREAQLRKLETAVDPDRLLDPEERAKRVKNLRLAQMQRMALKGTQAQQRKRAETAQRRKRGAR